MQIHQAARSAFLRYRDRGDPAALAEVFDLVAQELLLVACHFATGDDAEELVQETFVRAIHNAHTYDPVRPLEPWLVGILANVARRGARRGRRVEVPWDQTDLCSDQPGPPAAAASAEFAAALHAQLQQLPVPLREVLTWKLVHGMTPTEIAHAMGRPVGTVKSWVHRGVQRLRQLLPAGFAVALAASVRASTTLPAVRERVLAEGAAVAAAATATTAATAAAAIASAPPTAVPGSLGAVGTAIAAVGFLAFAGAAWLWSGANAAAAGAAAIAASAPASSSTSVRTAARPPADPGRTVVDAGAPALVLQVGGLVVPTVVTGFVEPRDGPDPGLQRRWFTTDAKGRAELRDLGAGAFTVQLDRAAAVAVDLDAGPALLTIELARGVDAMGVVEDGDGRPIPGASIWLSGADETDEGFAVATSGADGAFAVPQLPPGRCLAAMVPGWQASALRPVAGAAAARLVIDRAAAALAVAVTGPDGAPVPGAMVQFGVPPRFPAPGSAEECRERPALVVRADAAGVARCEHAAPGDRLWLCARAVGLPGVQRWIAVPAAGATRREALDLPAGGACRGAVRSAAGAVEVVACTLGWAEAAPMALPPWSQPRARTAADGSFRLAGIAAGDVVLRAGSGDAFAERLCVVVPGETCRWQPRLTGGDDLFGSAIGPDGQPLAGRIVEAVPPLGRTLRAEVGGDGAFRVRGLSDMPYDLLLRDPPANGGSVLARRSAVRPGDDAAFALGPGQVPDAFVSGWLLPAGGKPLDLWLTDERAERHYQAALAADGSFRFGPVPAGSYHWFATTDVNWVHRRVEVRAGAEVDLGAIERTPPLSIELVAAPGEVVPDHAYLWTADGRAMVSLCEFRGGRAELLTPPGRFVLWPVRDRAFLPGCQLDVRHDGQRVQLPALDPSATLVRLQAAPERAAPGQRAWWHLVGSGGDSWFTTSRLPGAAARGAAGMAAWLSPGRYRVECECGSLRGDLEWSVPLPSGAQVSAEAAVARFELR